MPDMNGAEVAKQLRRHREMAGARNRRPDGMGSRRGPTAHRGCGIRRPPDEAGRPGTDPANPRRGGAYPGLIHTHATCRVAAAGSATETWAPVVRNDAAGLNCRSGVHEVPTRSRGRHRSRCCRTHTTPALRPRCRRCWWPGPPSHARHSATSTPRGAVEPKIHDPWPTGRSRCLQHWWRIRRNSGYSVAREQRCHTRREPRGVPRVADEGAVIRPSHHIQEAGHHRTVKGQRRRQLEEQRPSFVGQAVGLRQKRDEWLSRVLQFQVVRDHPGHLDREPEPRRGAFTPLRIRLDGMWPMERRIDLCAGEPA